MCGIFGFDKLTPATRYMAMPLAWQMECRGTDAWGCTNGEEVIKKTGPIEESWELPEWERGIFHTRAASHGSPKEKDNAHPFSFQKADGTWVRGIHNGVISNHSSLNTKHNRKFEVDSMHAFANIAEGIPLTELEGWMALAWYEQKEGREGMDLYLLRHEMYDLHVCQLQDGEIVFCSLKHPITKAANFAGNPVKTEWDIRENILYRISEGICWNLGPQVMHQKEVRVLTHFVSGSGRFWDPESRTYTEALFGREASTGGYNGKEYCYQCGGVKIDRKKKLLCDGCMDKVIQEMQA